MERKKPYVKRLKDTDKIRGDGTRKQIRKGFIKKKTE